MRYEDIEKAVQLIERHPVSVNWMSMNKDTILKFADYTKPHAPAQPLNLIQQVPFYFGVPVYTDNSLPLNKARMVYSNGQQRIINVFEEGNYEIQEKTNCN